MKFCRSLIVLFLLVGCAIFSSAEENQKPIKKLKSYYDISSHNNSINYILNEIVKIDKFTITSNNEKKFSKIQKKLWSNLKLSKLNTNVEIFKLNPQKNYDALILINFNKKINKDKNTKDSKIIIDIKLVHINNFMYGIRSGTRLEFNICKLYVDSSVFENVNDCELIAKYLASKISNVANNINEISFEDDYGFEVQKNKNRVTPLESLNNCQLVADFDPKLAVQYRVWLVKDINEFKKLMTQAEQQGFTKKQSWGTILKNDKYNGNELNLFTKDNKRIYFKINSYDNDMRNPSLFVSYYEIVPDDDLKKSFLNFTKNNYKKAIESNMAYRSVNVDEKYCNTLATVDFQKQPLARCSHYFHPFFKYKKKKLINKLQNIFESKILQYQNNDLLFESLLMDYLGNIYHYSIMKEYYNYKLNPDKLLSQCKNHHFINYPKVKKATFKLGTTNTPLLLSFRDNDNELCLVIFKKKLSYNGDYRISSKSKTRSQEGASIGYGNEGTEWFVNKPKMNWVVKDLNNDSTTLTIDLSNVEK